MAVARMKRVSLLFPREERERVLARLQEAGVVQLELPEAEEVRPDDPEEGPAGGMVERLAHAIDYLERLAPEKKGLLASFLTLKEELSAEELAGRWEGIDSQSVCQEVMDVDLRICRVRARLEELADAQALLEPWRGLDLELAELDDRTSVLVRAYVMPEDGFASFLRGASDLPVLVHHVATVGRQAHLVAMWPRGVEEVEELLAAAGARRVSFGEASGTPLEELERLARERRALEAELQELEERAQAMAPLLSGLRALHDHYLAAAERGTLPLGRTERVGVATGWVREAEALGLKESLEQMGVAVLLEDPRPDEEPPVVLENPRWLQPFEVVTTLYGYPRYREVDPTPFLAPFFLVFFGLALADAGYGLALAVMSGLMIKRLGLGPGSDRLPRLLMYGGFAAVVFGMVGGSWFGDTLHLLPAWGPVVFARDVLARLDPVQDPLTMLMLSLGLGVAQVWTGIAIKLWLEVREGRVADGLWERGTWLLFIPSLILYGTAGSIGGPVAELAPKLVLVTALGVALGAARRQPVWLLKPFAGFLGLYGVMNYLGDVLSYARLLALGLASNIIGIVVNQIALLTGTIPLVGAVAAALVMAGGHVFNLLVSTLGSFVHSGRLQFVEFFTKFFEGGGRPFRPVRREGRYTVVRG